MLALAAEVANLTATLGQRLCRLADDFDDAAMGKLVTAIQAND